MIFVDTGPLVALWDAWDAKHRTVVAQLARLTTCPFVLCEPVLTEVCFLLPHPGQRRRLRALLSALRVQAAPDLDDTAFWSDVFDWLARYDDHEPDWADGCLTVLSARHPRSQVWTFEKEFRTTWRGPDGSPIPLAGRG